MKVVDMHCDTIVRMKEAIEERKAVELYKNNFNIDIQKMIKGDYLLQNFAIFTHLKNIKEPEYHVIQSIDLYYHELNKNKEYIKPVYSYSDIEENIKNNKMSALLTLEEGDVIYNDLEMLNVYYELGVRMICLTWNFKTNIGNPNFVSDENMTFKDMYKINVEEGLTDFGKEYVKKMEELGMIVDVSHLSDKGFYDVLEVTNKPFVASHSNARSECGVARNLTDDMIKKLSKRGGVMGINFCGDFLKESSEGDEFSYIDDMVRHIKHIVSVGGIDCVGIGTDFDGIAPNLEIKDASMMQELYKALKVDFKEEEIEKIFYKNVLRVYKEILR